MNSCGHDCVYALGSPDYNNRKMEIFFSDEKIVCFGVINTLSRGGNLFINFTGLNKWEANYGMFMLIARWWSSSG